MGFLVHIDSTLGAPAVAFMKVIRAISGSALNLRPMIVRPGGLGDLVVATAAVENLGLSPNSVDWLIESRSAPWACELGLPHACYDRFDTRLRQMVRLRRGLAINLEQFYGLSTAAALAMVAKNGVLTGFVTNRGAQGYDIRVSYDHDEHEVDAFQRALSTAFDLPLPSSSVRKRAFAEKDYCVLAIGGTAHPSRQLSVYDWTHLASLYGELPMVIACAPADQEIADRLRDGVPNCIGVVTGFSQVVTAIRSARRVVTIDGGLVHVASYFGVPVDAVFTAGRSAKWSPWSMGSAVIMRDDLQCQPCTRFGAVPECHNGFACKQRAKWKRFELDGFRKVISTGSPNDEARNRAF